MRVERAINKLIYSLSLKTAMSAKKHYHRKRMEESNSSLVRSFAEDWKEKDRREEYETKVLPYWERFGVAPKRFWFELAGSRNQEMDPRYIPSDLYYLELIPYINNMQFRIALEDKNYLEMRFPDVKQAGTVCRRVAGEYYDGEMNMISHEEAIELCRQSQTTLFIKPSLYSGFGRGINSFEPSRCTEEIIEELFMETGANFIVQEKIRQHPVLSSLNPDSVCTIRVLSLFIEGRVYIANTYLRVSVPGFSHVMTGNEYNVQILDDGRLEQIICLDEGGWIDNRKEEVFDEDVIIPSIDRVLAEVERLHPKVSHFKWLGWDFTVDEDGDPLLVEFNVSPGDHAQRVCANPLFGEMTDWVLDDFFFNRTLEDNQMKGVWLTNEDIRRYRE